MFHKSSGAKKLPLPRKNDFFLQSHFTNTPPDVPFAPKFIPAPLVSLQRFVTYKMSSEIEQDVRPKVILGENMGMKIDLVDLGKYDTDKKEKPLNGKDAFLLSDETVMTPSMKRSAQHSKMVSWMRKTEYISTESNRLGAATETKMGFNLKKKHLEEHQFRDKQSQIDAINKTFEDVRKPVREHYNKKGVTAVAEDFIFPDFANWKYQFSHVQFDGDTIPKELVAAGHLKNAQENSIICEMEFGNKELAALFVPTIDTLESIREIPARNPESILDFPHSYQLRREYTCKREDFRTDDRDVFVMYHRDNQWHYNEVDTMVKLTRNQQMNLNKNSIIHVTYRPWNTQETAELDERLANLYLQPKDRKQKELEKRSEENEYVAGPLKEKEAASSSEMSSDDEPPKRKQFLSSSEENSD